MLRRTWRFLLAFARHLGGDAALSFIATASKPLTLAESLTAARLLRSVRVAEAAEAEDAPLVWTDPPSWADPALWKPRTLLRGWVLGSDYASHRKALAAWHARADRPISEPLRRLPTVYSYAVEGFPTSWPAGTPREVMDRDLDERRAFRALDDSLAYRGIHKGDSFQVCTTWDARPGEVVIATPADGSAPNVGVYRVDGDRAWLEADGPAPVGRSLLAVGPFTHVWPAAYVTHDSVGTRDAASGMCLDRYPPEVFCPWWEADGDDRQRYPEGHTPSSGLVYLRPSDQDEITALVLRLIPNHPESKPDVHNMADVAAELAHWQWDALGWSEPLAELTGAMEKLLMGNGPVTLTREQAEAAHSIVCGLLGLVGDAVRHGARLAEALSRTCERRHEGAATWLAAADAHLAKTGCSLEHHSRWEASWCAEALAKLEAAVTPPDQRST